jgi:hypothetical protein
MSVMESIGITGIVPVRVVWVVKCVKCVSSEDPYSILYLCLKRPQKLKMSSDPDPLSQDPMQPT